MGLRQFRIAGIAGSLLALSACGGGGGGSGFVSTPTPPPQPTPQPPPATPSGALLAAVQTASPASPVANALTPNFNALGQSTEFPLLMTAVDATFGGDAATTQAGGTLTANPGGTFQLTLNNGALATTGVLAADYPGTTNGLFQVVTGVRSADLDYTRYGYWLRYQPSEGMINAGTWATGYVTPAADIPTQGTASYSGQATGIYNDAAACNCGDAFVSRLSGNVSLTADFGQSSLSGSMTNVLLTAFGGSQVGTLNDIGFSASIDRVNNLFAGTTFVTSQPGGTHAFGPTASGLVSGRFYGPAAREVGAVFSLSEGLRRLIGSFGLKRNP